MVKRASLYTSYHGTHEVIIHMNKSKWRQAFSAMHSRCYNKEYLEKNPTYNGCTVCVEWHESAVFKIWYESNYIDGYYLDKDIIKPGNKIYSPELCCFVTPAQNSLLIDRRNHRGKLPMNVFINNRGKYQVQIRINNRKKHFGIYETEIEAHKAALIAKRDIIVDASEKAGNINVKNGFLLHAKLFTDKLNKLD